MRVALAVEGTRGDVFPMLALGSALAERGHEIRIACPPGFVSDVEARGFEFAAGTADVHAWLASEAQAVAGGGSLRLQLAAQRFMAEHAEEQFAAAAAAAQGCDVVIAAGVMLGAATAAEMNGIPYRYVAYCPILFPSAEYPPPVFARQSLPRWLNRALWWPFLPLFDRTLRRSIDPARRSRGLAPVRNAHRHLLGERPVLAADSALAPFPSDTGFAPRSIACLHPMRGEAIPEKLEHFLAEGTPPVYFGFGSMTDPDPKSTTIALLDAVDRAGCRALVSEGWAGLGDQPLPTNVMRIGRVSHAELFRRVACVVHHGGAGTTTTAARAGVPQIVVPHLLDQHYWAARVHRLGVAPPAQTRRGLGGASLAAVLRAVLDNELMAERASDLGERLRADSTRNYRPEILLEGVSP